jgi:hypothetical protein
MKRWVLIIPVIAISGCVRSYFQPALPEYEYWKKPGATELEIKKSLLECGSPSPNPLFDLFKHDYKLTNEGAANRSLMVSFCMESIGYTKNLSVKKLCTLSHNEQLPVCMHKVPIYQPSVERRLNSKYCKRKSSYDYCVKTAMYPNGCKHNDYNNIVPECLP